MKQTTRKHQQSKKSWVSSRAKD